jgi:hypothetical protein
MMADIQLMISIEEAYDDRILEVVQVLESMGMQVRQVLPEIRVILGTIEEARMGELAQVEGIASIEIEQGFQLSPPDFNIQ